MAHYQKKERDPIEVFEDKRRTQLASLIYWLRKNCEFKRINGALHAAIVQQAAIDVFGAGAIKTTELVSLNIALPLILKKVNGGGNYHQMNDIMKACHILADDLEKEEMTRRREARQKDRG